MANVLHVNPNNAYQLLKELMNDQKFLEIAGRDAKKKFETFTKVFFDDIASDTDDLAGKLQSILGNQNKLMKDLNGYMSLNTNLLKFSIVLDAANLFATAVGFAIIHAELSKVSDKIDSLSETMKKGNDITNEFEFNKVLSKYTEMLEYRRLGKEFPTKDYRDLIYMEHNVLNLLYKSFISDVTFDQDAVLYTIVSLACMLSCTISYYDEIYYFENKDLVKDGQYWDISHSEWLKIYDLLSGKDFMNSVQDYLLLERNSTTTETDYFLYKLETTISDCVEAITNQQELVTMTKDKETHDEYKMYIDQNVKEEIDNMINAMPEEAQSLLSEIVASSERSLAIN